MPPPPPTLEPAPAPTLPDELLEEIFLRLPPDKPEWLVRASFASKLWLGRLSAPRFRGRYSEFHRAAPMLGFFYSHPYIKEEPPFVSTTKFSARIPDPLIFGYDVCDCRHGRVLLRRSEVSSIPLVVLDPITGCLTELDAPSRGNHSGAVLCAVNGCDHRACHGGPSRVVFVCLYYDDDDDDDDDRCVAYAYESLPETGQRMKPHSQLGQWSKRSAGLILGHDPSAQLETPVLIQDTLYFKLMYDGYDVGILEYDLSSKCLSLIVVPLAEEDIASSTILMGMEDGSLGFAHPEGSSLNLWSRQMGSGGVGSWMKCRVIDLNEILLAPEKRLRPVGSVEGGDIIFVTTELGTYEINLKSLEPKNIWKRVFLTTLFPYMSFYYPQGRVNPCDVAH